ncbi:MAG: hypothetical protein JJU23_12750 [Cyclobacteriaceae bacterium]|nr:hypothetical protein [Cyclobacteriaceae bacterium]
MKTIFLCCFTVSIFSILSLKVSAQNTDQDSILHTQIITRELDLSKGYGGMMGKLQLTADEVIFTSRNKKGIGSFTLNYNDIYAVKKRSLITPNRIIIHDKNYAKFTFSTYKRKEIVSIMKSKM